MKWTEHHLRQRIAANVRRLREGAGLTLADAGEQAGMHWRHWQKIEAEEVSVTLRSLANLANALGVTPADLIADPPRRS